MNSKDQHDVVHLATTENPFQAHLWQQALEKEGIRCRVVGDYLDAGIGDIPGFSPEVWVDASDLARAAAFLRSHQERSGNDVRPEKHS